MSSTSRRTDGRVLAAAVLLFGASYGAVRALSPRTGPGHEATVERAAQEEIGEGRDDVGWRTRQRRVSRALRAVGQALAAPKTAGPARVPVPETLSELAAASLQDPRIRGAESKVRERLRAQVDRLVRGCAGPAIAEAWTFLRFEGHLVSNAAEARLESPRLGGVGYGAGLDESALDCIRERLGAPIAVTPRASESFGAFSGEVSMLVEFGPPGDPARAPQGSRPKM